jgi:antiviral defense system Shedu protein SduA
MAEPSDNVLFTDTFVPWQELTRYEIVAFEAALDEAQYEFDMQRFLETHPQLLIQLLTAGRGAFVLPKVRLGSEYEADFLIAHEASGGLVWCAVELESPRAKVFTKKGDPSAILYHALRQISDWREWLSRNRDYAERPRKLQGLGLTDIDPELPGLIIIGRGSDIDKEATLRRRRMARDNKVQIETYDWLLAQAKERTEERQAEIVRVANDIAKWHEIASLAEGPIGGPVIEVLLTNIEPDDTKDVGWTPASAISANIPPKYGDLVAEMREILVEVRSELKSVYYHKLNDYVVLTPSGYISSTHAKRILRAGRKSSSKYMMMAYVYHPDEELLSHDPRWRVARSQ